MTKSVHKQKSYDVFRFCQSCQTLKQLVYTLSMMSILYLWWVYFIYGEYTLSMVGPNHFNGMIEYDWIHEYWWYIPTGYDIMTSDAGFQSIKPGVSKLWKFKAKVRIPAMVRIRIHPFFCCPNPDPHKISGQDHLKIWYFSNHLFFYVKKEKI